MRILVRLHPKRIAVAAAVFSVLAIVFSPSASAHSFLIRSQPEAGARLAHAPATMTLYFSEAFVRGSQQVTLRNANGETLKLPSSKEAGTVIRQPLPRKLRGVFVVSWRVLSDDGHISLGEFAFAAGSSAALPKVSGGGQGTSWSEVAASWLVFVGLALGLGGLASERFVWRTAGRETIGAAAPVALGLALAGVGGLLELVLLAGNRRGGGFGSGFSGGALADALASRPGKLTLAILAALALAAVIVSMRRLRVAAIVPLLAAVVFVAERGHSGTSGKSWAVAADSIHLALVAAWLGALAHLIVTVLRADEPRPALVEGANRYARFALPTVLVVLASGVATAFPEFRSVSAVYSSGYGRDLLIKSGLIGVGLFLALAARLRALAGNPRMRLPLLRRLTIAEATTLSGALVAAAVLVNGAPPRGPTPARASIAVLGPPPLAGPAVRLADLAGQLVLGMAASERELQFTILPPDHSTAQASTLEADARGPDGRSVDLFPRSCGPGCFVIRYRLRPGTTVVSANVKASGWTGGKARFAVTWPFSRPADRLLRRVTHATRSLGAVTLREQVTSGPGSRPTNATYTLSGKAFLGTELYGSGAVDVRRLGSAHGLTALAFAFPGSNVWYRMWVDTQARIRRETIVSVGHLIRRSFRYGARPTSASSLATPSPLGKIPDPPPGAIVLGQEDGDLAVGLAARQLGTQLELRTTVIGSSGAPLDGLTVTYEVPGAKGVARKTTKSCGSGCYAASIGGSAPATVIRVDIAGGGSAPSSLSFTLPQPWPPPTADTLVQQATRVYRNLNTLVIHERLASSPTQFVVDVFQLQAPDRLRYDINGGSSATGVGSSAIIIGDHRWDKQPGGAWKESPQTPIHQPTPFWSSESNAHRIGSTRIAGRQAWLLSFYDRNISAFFTIAVDKKTRRTLDLRMTAAAHFMHHRYSEFNAPLALEPPG